MWTLCFPSQGAIIVYCTANWASIPCSPYVATCVLGVEVGLSGRDQDKWSGELQEVQFGGHLVGLGVNVFHHQFSVSSSVHYEL